MRPTAQLWVVLLLSLTGCSSDSEPSATEDDDGGVITPLTVHAGYYLNEQEPLALLADGAPIVLVLAAQGGQVMYVGARVEGLAPGVARLSAQLSDPATGALAASDSRLVEFRLTADNPAEVEPDVRSRSQFAHLWACPNLEPRPIAGVPWKLEVSVASPDGASAGKSELVVTPTCSYGADSLIELCKCECDANYVFGKCGAPG